MQLPRRVPWVTLAELDQLCSWVYGEDAHDGSRDLAIQRLSAWRFMTPLPHALESLLSILVAVRQDTAFDNGSPTWTSSLSLRQSYATALIRLVNGLVDPLQAGTYARSILSIAAQIGFPAWLVELRHTATHEDLPSLELLRDGAKESLSWLLHNYFVPTLNPEAAQASAPPPIVVRPVEPLLARYKSLLKTVSRDASLRARHAADISGALREIERWLAEARVAAAAAVAHTYTYPHTSEELVAAVSALAAAVVDRDDHDGDDEELEPREAWALDRLCDVLLIKGAIVPVSRKKRVSPKGSSHHPPASLLAIWVPLLESVAANHAHFPAVLTSRIIARLLSNQDGESEHEEHERDRDRDDDATTTAAAATATERASHDVCLAAWAAWLVERRRGNSNSNSNSGDEPDADIATRRQDIFFQLVQALAAATPQRQRETSSSSYHCAGARALLTALCASDRRLADISNALLDSSTKIDVDVKEDAPVWCEADLDVMESRAKAALALSRHPPISASGHNPPLGTREERPSVRSEEKSLPSGWRLLSESDGWRPCPIGVRCE